ncbi:MAG TPA: HEAT repeat domain-containing protein [Anaeromyxobacteraceae bacterium]|nr:HEAT repeat domain-containing protein [Anaeromyxobacteraceae bacterium]
MGILDLFGSRESREQAGLKKLGQKITQKWGPAENRQKAIEQLGELGTEAALKTLCLRFTIRAEVGIQDDEEKEQTRAILVAAGPRALGPVREFLAEQESGVAWGLRVLASLAPAPEVLGTVLSLLQKLGQEYSRDPEKKLVLLSWLREHPDLATLEPASGPSLEAAVFPLLEDFVDDVRIGAVRALTVAPPTDASREALIALLLRDRDNARVRGEVLQALHDRGADVKGHRPDVEALLVEPWFLDREGRVKRRGE